MLLNTTFNASEAQAFGQLLRIARESGDWSLTAMAQKTGLREAQLQALEECNCAVFRRNNQEMLWAARLYARKLGLEMPAGLSFSMQNPSPTLASTELSINRAIPAFLIKTP